MKYFILSACLLCFSFSSVNAQSYSRFSREVFKQGSDSLQYRFLNPDANRMRKFPLVIFLHGAGERGSDNEAQLKWGVTNFATDENMMKRTAFVIAPQCPAGQTWAGLSGAQSGNIKMSAEPTMPMRLLRALIDQTVKRYPVDTTRIYITGLSMGGFGTYDAIERYPGLFAAAVPVCAGGDTSMASTIASIPMWIYHGAEDPTVNPINSLNMFSALMKAGAHPGFTQFPESGHFSWLGVYIDEIMLEWLFRQHK